jgi:hypothetical protein
MKFERYLLQEYYGLDRSFRIDSVDCVLNLTDIYDRIEFAAED